MPADDGAAAPGPPASGGWRPGDPAGSRRFLDLFVGAPLELEAGGELGPISVAYETWGELDAERSNAVLVLHALTGDSHAAGPAGDGHPSQGWWDGLIGPGRAIDTDRFFVIAPNVLGGCQGTTGPSSPHPVDGQPYGSRFPEISVRDQVAVEIALLDALGIHRLRSAIGGSMGGMRALELAMVAPERVGSMALLATGAAATAEQIALCHAQACALELDPAFSGGDYYDASPGEGPWRGMGAARRIGQITYRTRSELRERFGRQAQEGEDPLAGGRFAVEGYLDHHAEKLSWRFDANSYLVLSRAMDRHDVGRGRGGVAAALRSCAVPAVVVSFSSDRLYHPDEQEAIAAGLGGESRLVRVDSPLGHDAFLLEIEAISPILAELLA